MGGRAAFLTDTRLPLAAAVSFYGGGIASKHLSLATNLNGPIMLLWGGKDANIPASDRRAIADALTEAGKDFVNVEFSHANHGFFCDARESYSPRAAKEAWPLVLAFLNENCRSQ